MQRLPLRIAPHSVPTWEASLAGFGVLRADRTAVAALRQSPGAFGGPQVTARFLHHADEQTVVGLAVVLETIAANGFRVADLSRWGVIGAPRFPGRSIGAVTLPKFGVGGPAVVSPHSIPQLSLHSLSGAISVALGMHGPNFGVGGGPGAIQEGMLAALTMLDEADAPGLWLVVTEWSPELAIDAAGECAGEQPVCHAVALALASQSAGALRLRLTAAGLRGRTDDRAPAPLTVSSLAGHLSAAHLGSRRITLSTECQLEILPTAACETSTARRAA